MSRSMLYAVAIAVLAGSGCAGSRAAERESSVLRVQVAELRAERRRHKREIRDLQRQLLKKRDYQPASVLPVEVREPDPPEQSDPGSSYVSTPEGDGEIAYVTEDNVEVVYVGEAAKRDSVRPTLKLYESHSRPRYRRPAQARKSVAPVPRPKERLPVVDGKVPPITALVAKSSRPVAKDPRSDYKRHYRALRDGDHEVAIAGFRDFVKRYPKHEYADNAQYWLGEAFYDRREYKPALAEFRKVVEEFPKGNKAGDAMLKSAYCYEFLGHRAKARDVLEHIVNKFPKSNAAVLAADRLVNLESD